MNILLISPWGDHGGIAEHSAQLVSAVEQADQGIVWTVDPDLHPAHVLSIPKDEFPPVVVLNYHAAQLSQWHATHIKDAQLLGAKVVVIYHDTGVPNTDQCKRLWEVADAFIVHEPCEDLPGAIYWRMGVPEFDGLEAQRGIQHYRRPMLGTLGFNFGWKNWPELARITRKCGWGFLICTPDLSAADEQGLRDLNPWLDVRRGLSTPEAIDVLHTCAATAFVNVCHNAGQSAAILMGIAARKPVFALESCRQYRALYADPLANKYIRWCADFVQLQQRLSNVIPGAFDAGIVALAEQESWEHLGEKYAQLFRKLVA